MLNATRRAPGRQMQAGLSMIESLVAMLILALGMAALAWTQARLIVEGRDANARATAMLLISDLANRMAFNQATALADGYQLAWGGAPASRNCSTPCSGSELAQSDLNAWRTSLMQALPTGDAAVFRSTVDARQIGIAVAWSTTESKAAMVDAANYRAPFAVTAATHGVDCPIALQCHVVYVQP